LFLEDDLLLPGAVLAATLLEPEEEILIELPGR
jgi:hypothetical protein